MLLAFELLKSSANMGLFGLYLGELKIEVQLNVMDPNEEVIN